MAAKHVVMSATAGFTSRFDRVSVGDSGMMGGAGPGGDTTLATDAVDTGAQGAMNDGASPSFSSPAAPVEPLDVHSLQEQQEKQEDDWENCMSALCSGAEKGGLRQYQPLTAHAGSQHSHDRPEN